jgi:hypothetical protein
MSAQQLELVGREDGLQIRSVLHPVIGSPIHVRWSTDSAATPMGQLAYFIEFLHLTGLWARWVESCRGVNLFVDNLLSNSFYLRVHEWGMDPNRVVFAKSSTPPAYGLQRGGFRAARPSSRRYFFAFYRQPLHPQ